MLRTNRRARSREVQIRTRMEATRAFCERGDTLGTLTDHVVSMKHPAEEERTIRAERAVIISLEPLRDAIAVNPGLIRDDMIVWVTAEGPKGAKRTDN